MPAELAPAILALEHDAPTLARLAYTGRRALLWRDERAFAIAFALCGPLP